MRCDFLPDFQAKFLKFFVQNGVYFLKVGQNSQFSQKNISAIKRSFTPKLKLDIVLNVHGVTQRNLKVGTNINRNFPEYGGDRPVAVEVPSASKHFSVASKNICNKSICTATQ